MRSIVSLTEGMTNYTPQYTILSGHADVPDAEADDVDAAVAAASDFLDDATDPVEIVDPKGNAVFDPPELMDRIIEYRRQRRHG